MSYYIVHRPPKGGSQKENPEKGPLLSYLKVTQK